LKKLGVFFVFISLVAISFLSPKIDIYNHAFMTSTSFRDVPFFMQLLGEGGEILSNLSILQADLYFHGGVGHFDKEHKEGLAIGETEEEALGEHECIYAHTEKPSKANILFRISDEVNVSEHIHLHGDEAKEIVPWLYFATRVDPHNILAYTLTSYWVTEKLGKVEEGFDFLKEGLQNNPDSWEINAELGRMYYKYPKDYETAIRYLSRARILMKRAPHDKFQERYVLFYLALSYEALGQKREALEIYRYLNTVFPGAYDRKIKELI
jgi:tetratricopeptide (TPR) repeat protein